MRPPTIGARACVLHINMPGIASTAACVGLDTMAAAASRLEARRSGLLATACMPFKMPGGSRVPFDFCTRKTGSKCVG